MEVGFGMVGSAVPVPDLLEGPAAIEEPVGEGAGPFHGASARTRATITTTATAMTATTTE